MARFARVVVVDVAHHVTQRGNARQVILSSDGDRVAYLEVLRQYSELRQKEWGMSRPALRFMNSRRKAAQKFYGKIIMFPHREKTMVPLPSVPALSSTSGENNGAT